VKSRTDTELLRDYAEDGSEAAFSELVRRHLDFVYSTAVRLLKDASLAEDVCQKVFVALAQSARQVSGYTVLSGWLHRTARNLSANAIRSDVRRRAREQEAAAMNQLFAGEPDAGWKSIAPHLDAALSELSDSDRDAVLLRYFQQKSAHQMSQVLGISGQAAQKRVNRAVEHLREAFVQRGVTVGVSGLALLLTANAVRCAPIGLAAAISSGVLAGTIIRTTATIATAKVIVMTTLQKTLIVSTLALLTGAGVYETRKVAQIRERTRASQADQALARQGRLSRGEPGTIANRASNRPSPAFFSPPRAQASLTKNMSSGVPWTSTRMYSLLTNKVARLTLTQIEPYLKAKGRNATSLLAGFRTTFDPALLREAMKKYPNDPQVGFEAATRNIASPAERRQGLDLFKQNAPDNALADYLSAVGHLKAGQMEPAIQDLVASSSKSQFNDYAADRVQADEEAYLAAGYPPGEAKLLANTFLPTPHLVQVKELGLKLVDLAGVYQQSGDQGSRAAALQRAAELGQRLNDQSGPIPLATQLVGISIERAALNAMEPTAQYVNPNQTVQERLDQLVQQKGAIHLISNQADQLWPTLSDQEWVEYHNHLAASGEQAALGWLLSTYASR